MADYTGHSPKILVSEGNLLGHNPAIEGFEGKIQALWQEACGSFRTNKARITKMLEILPADLRIPQTVILSQDKDGLRGEIEQGIRDNREIGLRTCFNNAQTPPAGTAPWIMGLNQEKLVSAFFDEQPLPKTPIWTGFQETYRDWQKYPGLTEIIVMKNPPGLGRGNLRGKHFVFRVETVDTNLRAELRIGTDQMRDIEGRAKRADLIEITMDISENGYGIFIPGKIKLEPGRNYLTKHLKIRSFPYKITKQVMETVFGQWCPQFYYLLLALDKFGLGAIEFQGRQDKGKVTWILAHGFRGVREEKMTYL